MTTAEDYALTEMWFWRLVSVATAILGADQEKAEALRANVLDQPWEGRRFLYNSSPLDVAADLAGVVPSEDQTDAFRVHEQQAIDAIDHALSEQSPIQTAAAHRYRIDVDRLAATG
jgi:hypothetical protein